MRYSELGRCPRHREWGKGSEYPISNKEYPMTKDVGAPINRGRLCGDPAVRRDPSTWILDIPCTPAVALAVVGWLLDIERGGGWGKKNQ